MAQATEVFRITAVSTTMTDQVTVKQLTEAQAADERQYRAAKMLDASLTFSDDVNPDTITLGAHFDAEIVGKKDHVLLLKVTRVRQ